MTRLINQFKRRGKFLLSAIWPIRGCFFSADFKKQADRFLKEKQQNMVFVLGAGRSGTQLIADVLSGTNQAIVFHEPNFFEDVGTMDSLRRDQAKACDYWAKYRKYEVYKRWQEAPGAKVYGEINGTIRYQLPGILNEFPEANIFLLSRDGRGFVRSVMGWRQFYGKRSKGAYALEPLPGDPYREQWPKMSRFEKICWGWMETNEYLLKQIPSKRILRLEDLVADYEVIKTILDGLGLELSKEKWVKIVSKPSKNASKSYSFPEWSQWEPCQREAFEVICGGTMKKLGYSLK